MIKRRDISLVMTGMCTVLLFLLTSCSVLQPPPGQVKSGKQQQITPPVIKDSGDAVEKSKYADLEQKADNEIKAGKYRSALNIYNNLLSKYSGKDKDRLLGKTEALLSIMKNSDLEIVLNSSKKYIPDSMLLYRLGLNYAEKDENSKAEEMLNRFLQDYPDHPRAIEVKNTLKMLAEKSFARNSIGCMLPLSGKYQIFGKQALRGIQMAQDDLKALYGDQQIVFVVKDTESNDEKTVECVQELAQSNVAAIAGPLVTAEAAAKEAQKMKIPMVCITQKSEVTAAGDYIFSNFITPEIQIAGLVTHAIGTLGVKNFAILYPDDKYGQTFMGLFKNALAKAGGNLVVSEVYGANQTDFSSAIQKLAAITPQGTKDQTGDQSQNSDILPDPSAATAITTAIFIPDAPSRVALILPQLMYYNVKDTYLLGTNIWHNNALLKIAPEHLRNIVITDGYFAGSMKPEAARFSQAFKAVYGEDPGLIEAIAYDTASMLIKTAMDPAIDSRDSLKKVLAGNMIYNGVTGETMFEVNGNARKELFFLTVENNTFVEIRH
ncbi:MAG: penicillin-binding protein activator, partial [Desulfamplus sp.]|nr:penicillin-binding protein activator [Desulfamplus sp.]